MKPTIRVANADALRHECDVLVLKYAQGRHGVDKVVAGALRMSGHREGALSPPVGELSLVESKGTLSARYVLFVGVPPLYQLGYREIGDIARRSLRFIAANLPDVKRVAYTVHGPGYGLDERESFLSLVAGIIESLTNDGRFNQSLETTVVEVDSGRASRFIQYLKDVEVPKPPSPGRPDRQESESGSEARLPAGDSGEKPHVFVAMPFDSLKLDHFHYGIQPAVHSAGFLCERLDISSFTGGIVDQIKGKIASAELVVAELSGANPNVYLEVGYAWGKGIPTILLAERPEDLEFDVKGQRTLVYSSIRDLEEKLARELRNLRAP